MFNVTFFANVVLRTLVGKVLPDPVSNLQKSFIDNVIRDRVTPVAGSIVYCELALGAGEHSGVFVGNGKIAHLDGSGRIELVAPSEFLNRLNGFNTAISIYVSSRGGSSIGGAAIAQRAAEMVGRSRNYNVILDNCHQFTSGCITGNFDNADNFLWMLKDTSKREIGCDSWRVWERNG